MRCAIAWIPRSVLSRLVEQPAPVRRVLRRPVVARSGCKLELPADPQQLVNEVRACAEVVPLEGAGENLKLTISSPIQMPGVAKVPAKRAPELGEHNDEVLKELGFEAKEIERLRASGERLPASP